MGLRSCFRCGDDFLASSRERVCRSCRAPEPSMRPLNPELSLREKQVATLVMQGKLNKIIAYELHLTEGTVKEYLCRIFRKAGVSNRTALAVWWQCANCPQKQKAE